jgi:hypothetical protein
MLYNGMLQALLMLAQQAKATTMNTVTSRPWPLYLRRVVACAMLAFCTVTSHAARDTVLGVELIPANMPVSSVDDVGRSLWLTSQVGGHVSKIWHWGDPAALSFVRPMMQQASQFGLMTLMQMGTIFLGEPAPPPGYVSSFANPSTRERFLADVRLLAEMRPNYLVLTTEANLMYRFNPVEFENYRAVYAQAYALVKSVSPSTQVGVSYLYSLWFANYHLDKIDVPAKLTPSDFVAFTSYPEWLIREGHFATIADIPVEWYGAARMAYPNARILFSEVGWASKVRGTPAIQAEYLRNLPRLMSTVKPELVTWAVLHDSEYFSRDLLTPEATAFLISIGVDIDALFGHFNGMGLLDGFGNPKIGFYEAVQVNFAKP